MKPRGESKGDSLRKRAEKILSQKPQNVQKIPVEDITRLIHEIDVHQIELDMQNDELRRAQAEIELSRAKYVDLYDFAPIGYFTFDQKGMILEANLAGAKLFEVGRSLLLHQPFTRFVSPEFRNTFHHHLERVFSTGTKETCELRIVRKNGTSFYVSLEGIASKDSETQPIQCRSAIIDITERIKFRVDNALQHAGKDANVATESLNTIIPVIQEGIEECRRMQMDLRPPMLDDLGLLATLSWFFRRFQTIYSMIQVEVEQTLEERDIPNSLKIVIFRVTQEGMNNVAKHSKANLVHVSLRKMDGRIELVLRDNGQGFDLKRVLASESMERGLGLTSMRERAELSGGSFAIESITGKGTTIRVSWPVTS